MLINLDVQCPYCGELRPYTAELPPVLLEDWRIIERYKSFGRPLSPPSFVVFCGAGPIDDGGGCGGRFVVDWSVYMEIRPRSRSRALVGEDRRVAERSADELEDIVFEQIDEADLVVGAAVFFEADGKQRRGIITATPAGSGGRCYSVKTGRGASEFVHYIERAEILGIART